MSTMRLSSETNARHEDIAIIENGVDEFNMRYTGDYNYRPVRIFLRDEANQIFGGITADLWGGWMYVDYLWIDEGLRGQDFGTRLMEAAEAEARAHGCHHAFLDTFSFQARPFYEKLGYEVIGTMDNYPKGEQQYWMKKQL
jgi:GNAT superfamily N-acetyltransferase